MEFEVRQVAAGDVYPLRQRVLRPHQTVAAVAFDGDDDPDAGHFAAFDTVGGESSGEIIGVATVLRQAPPGETDPDLGFWWRLRGMATAEQARKRGVGTALVDAVVAHAAGHQAARLWCYARLPAAGFYRAAGFEATGEPWEESAIGPHIAMWRPLP